MNTRTVNSAGWEVQILVPDTGWVNIFCTLECSPHIFETQEEAEDFMQVLRPANDVEVRVYESLK